MTLSPLELLSVLCAPLVLGAGLLRALGLRARDDLLAFVPWCALAGGLGTGALLFLWCWLGWPLDARLLAPLVVLGGVVAWTAGARRGPELALAPPRATSAPRLERVFFAAVVVLLSAATLARIVRASTGAIVIGDEARIWTLKARLLFDAGGINAVLAERASAFGDGHPDYPLLDPLLQLWALVHARAQLLVEPRFPIQVFALALVPALAAALRRILRPAAAALVLLFVYCLDATIDFTGGSTADLMVALGFVVASDAALRWMRGGAARWARLVWVALAFVLATKNEGALLVLAFLVSAAACRLRAGTPRLRPDRWTLACAALPLAVVAAGWFTNLHLGFRNDLATAAAPRILVEGFRERIGPVLAYFGRLYFLRPKENGGLYAVLITMSVLVPLRLLRGRARLLTLTAWIAIAGWLLVYLATPHELEWHLRSSAMRVTYQLVPALGLWLAVVLAEDPVLGRRLRARSHGA